MTATASNNTTNPMMRRRVQREGGETGRLSDIETVPALTEKAVLSTSRSPFLLLRARVETGRNKNRSQERRLPTYELQSVIWNATSRATCWGLNSPSCVEKRIQLMYLLALISGNAPCVGSTQTRSSWNCLPPSICW
ncbi:hypothetical protein G6F68_018842 [Rhizopus microsporus]|nr:hypothetical protein G6F68_018842 [Rhizopus microsporus]